MPFGSAADPTALPAFFEFDAPEDWRAIDFISDIHLAQALPQTVAAWRDHLLETPADAVFILGDLFEVWVGDDARHLPFERECTEVLAEAASRRSIAFMAGNRDFLLGARMLRDTGVMGLADPTLLRAWGQRLLLSHGDALCLADIGYQGFRAEVRGEAWQREFLAKPLDERLRIAQEIRRRSGGRRGDAQYADVDTATAVGWMHAVSATEFVHGHTHRPGSEALAPGYRRHVLSDWDLDDAALPRAEVMRLTRDGLERVAPTRPAPLMWQRLWQTLSKRREDAAVARRPIPDDLWKRTLVRYPFLRRRDPAAAAELRRLTSLFLDRKEFSARPGVRLTDAVAVAVAAQACLPVLRLGLGAYDGFVGIVLHPDQVVARRTTTDDDGVVHEYDEVLVGEAMQGGPVMLSWRDVRAAGRSADIAYNVVIHEFAHVLDMVDGVADGVPPLPPDLPPAEWQRVLGAEYEAFCRRVDADEDTALDPYGAEEPDEFFAVASEAFFVAPQAMQAEHPALYALFTRLYRQDPATETG